MTKYQYTYHKEGGMKMKKELKKILSAVIACSMLSGTASVFAENVVKVTKVEVLGGDGTAVETYTDDLTDIKLTPEQMLQVTLNVESTEENQSDKAVFVSFLSYMTEGTLSNDTVQYVAQRLAENGSATIKFRPRASLGEGTFAAKSGATDAKTAAVFNYEVKTADKIITLTGKKNSIKANSTEDATFVIGDFAGEDYSGFAVYIDESETALDSGKYTIEKTDNELVLAVKHENFADKKAGSKIKVTVKHDGYVDISGEIAITDAVWNVTLNNNGGELAEGSTAVTSYTSGTAETLPILTKEHYTFDGWCVNKDCTDTPIKVIPADATGDKTYYAKFTAETYRINYELNGGTVADDAKVENYKYGEGAVLPTPAREHYKFDGWYTTPDFQGEKTEKITAEDFDAKTYYAKWSGEEYTVKLNPNGGTIADGKNVTEYTYATSVQLPTSEDMTNTGYYFAGWYDNEEFNGEPISAISVTDFGDKTYYAKWNKNAPTEYLITFVDYDGTELQKGNVNVGEMPTCDVPTRKSDDKYDYKFEKWTPEITAVTDNATYTAVYTQTARTYTVTLNVNEGSIAEGKDVTSYTYGTAVTLPIPTKEHYTFEGWYEKADFTGTAVTGISAVSTGDKTYYAKWSGKEYRVTLDTNGGKINGENVTEYQYGTLVTLPTDVTRENYTFAGWYDSSDSKVTQISADDFGDKEFKAKWTGNKYKITYELDGGTLADNAVKEYEYGKGITTLPTPVKDGYTFGGWYDNAELDGDAVNGIAADSVNDKKLYAKWLTNVTTYKIDYELNGGKFAETPAGEYVQGVGAVLPAPVKDGYTFGGWYDNTELTGEKVTSILADAAGDKKFYAKWFMNNTEIEVLDNFKDKLTVKKLAEDDGTVTITVTAKDNSQIPLLKMYRAVYVVENGKIYMAEVEEIENNNNVFKLTAKALSDGEIAKVMLWCEDNKVPVIKVIN